MTSSFSSFFKIASILTPKFSAMSRASKILSLSTLDRFSCGDFLGPLNNVGEDRGLFFRFGGMNFLQLYFQRRPKVGARLNVFHSAVMPVPVFIFVSSNARNSCFTYNLPYKFNCYRLE